jgi:hypothetical protein
MYPIELLLFLEFSAPFSLLLNFPIVNWSEIYTHCTIFQTYNKLPWAVYNSFLVFALHLECFVI